MVNMIDLLSVPCRKENQNIYISISKKKDGYKIKFDDSGQRQSYLTIKLHVKILYNKYITYITVCPDFPLKILLRQESIKDVM